MSYWLHSAAKAELAESAEYYNQHVSYYSKQLFLQS